MKGPKLNNHKGGKIEGQTKFKFEYEGLIFFREMILLILKIAVLIVNSQIITLLVVKVIGLCDDEVMSLESYEIIVLKSKIFQSNVT